MESIAIPPTLVKLSARSWKNLYYYSWRYSWWLPSFYIFRKKLRLFFHGSLAPLDILHIFINNWTLNTFFQYFLRGLCCGATWRPPGIYSSPAAAASVRGRARKPQVRHCTVRKARKEGRKARKPQVSECTVSFWLNWRIEPGNGITVPCYRVHCNI